MNNAGECSQNVSYARLLLQYTYGLVYIVAGLDKISGLNVITDWSKYLNVKLMLSLNGYNITAYTFFAFVGIFEIILGLITITYSP